MSKEYIIEERYRRHVGHGSLGMTNKYYMDNYWYKQNLKGYEGKSEELVSRLLDYTNIDDYVKYEECIINGVPGCRSKNFLRDGESLVTLTRLYNLTYGGDLKNKINTYSRLNDRIEYVIDFVKEYTDLDIYNYLGKVLKIDMLTYDVDRHFNNLAVIKTREGFREAPLFDFGVSFFSLRNIFTQDMSLEEKINKMTPQPFSSTFEEQAEYFSKVEVTLDYEGIKKEFSDQDLDIQEMLKFNLDKYKEFFPDVRKERTAELLDRDR